MSKQNKSKKDDYHPSEYQKRQMELRRKIEQIREERELNAEIADYPDE